MSDTPKQYERRNTIDLGEYFQRHMYSMTAEDLYGKAEIAAELGHRDMVIDQLERELNELRKDKARLDWMRDAVGMTNDCLFEYNTCFGWRPCFCSDEQCELGLRESIDAQMQPSAKLAEGGNHENH